MNTIQINDSVAFQIKRLLYKHSVLNKTDATLTETFTFSKVFASILVIFSGVVLLSDKIVVLNLTELYGFRNEQTLIWLVSQTVSPMILCLGALLSPYKLTYFGTLYLYFIQFYWIFNPSAYQLDDVLLHVYALGFCAVIFVSLILFLLIMSIIVNENKILLKNIKKLTSHIVLSIKGGYIKEEKKEEYIEDTIKVFDSLD